MRKLLAAFLILGTFFAASGQKEILKNEVPYSFFFVGSERIRRQLPTELLSQSQYRQNRIAGSFATQKKNKRQKADTVTKGVWMRPKDSKVSCKLLKAGTDNGQPVKEARASFKEGLLVGKYVSRHGQAYVPFLNQEHKVPKQDIEVLCGSKNHWQPFNNKNDFTFTPGNKVVIGGYTAEGKQDLYSCKVDAGGEKQSIGKVGMLHKKCFYSHNATVHYLLSLVRQGRQICTKQKFASLELIDEQRGLPYLHHSRRISLLCSNKMRKGRPLRPNG